MHILPGRIMSCGPTTWPVVDEIPIAWWLNWVQSNVWCWASSFLVKRSNVFFAASEDLVNFQVHNFLVSLDLGWNLGMSTSLISMFLFKQIHASPHLRDAPRGLGARPLPLGRPILWASPEGWEDWNPPKHWEYNGDMMGYENSNQF